MRQGHSKLVEPHVGALIGIRVGLTRAPGHVYLGMSQTECVTAQGLARVCRDSRTGRPDMMLGDRKDVQDEETQDGI